MFLVGQIRKMSDWGRHSSRIGVVSLEEYLDVLGCFRSGIQEISVTCRDIDKVIGNRVLNILLNFLHLEVNFLLFKGYRSNAIGDGFNGFMEKIFVHCVWVDIWVQRRQQ